LEQLLARKFSRQGVAIGLVGGVSREDGGEIKSIRG
jgi:hypothetical protein